MHIRFKLSVLAILALLQCVAADFYVDADRGDDAADGRTPQTAWRTLARTARGGAVKPGDTVRLKRGCIWRESLVPVSGKPGAPVVYTSYGTGAKPVLQGSRDRSRPEDWVRTGPDLWSTRAEAPARGRRVWDGSQDVGDWSRTGFTGGVTGRVTTVCEDGAPFVRLAFAKQGATGGMVNLWGPRLVAPPMNAVMEIRARASKPCRLARVGFGIFRAPHSPGLYGYLPFAGTNDWLGTEWRTFTATLWNDYPSAEAHFYFPLPAAELPDGVTLDFQPVGVWEAAPGPADPLPRDVGILILDHGARWGVKRWCRPDWTPANPCWRGHDVLAHDLDFWYEPLTQRVTVRYPRNPGEAFGSIELALDAHLVDQSYRAHVIYDGLWLRYGAAHGFGGGETSHLTIRNCDICWIGGGLQNWGRDAKTGRLTGPTRYGNGIEFWANGSHHLVERNRLWEIYDAALSNQGCGNRMIDVTWRHNVIWNAEYSFEHWNPKGVTVDNVFEHNTCVDAGGGWSYAQRPNPCATHVMYFSNRANVTNFVVRDNVFVGTSNQCVLAMTDWRAQLVHDCNLVYPSPGKPVLRWLSWGKEGMRDWKGYQALGFDPHGLSAAPVFRDAAKRDYRLAPGSPGAGAGAAADVFETEGK